jgi:hypothetical protein
MFECKNAQDLHMVEMEDFKYGGTNITAFRLVDPGSELVQQVFIFRLSITCRLLLKGKHHEIFQLCLSNLADLHEVALITEISIYQ